MYNALNSKQCLGNISHNTKMKRSTKKEDNNNT